MGKSSSNTALKPNLFQSIFSFQNSTGNPTHLQFLNINTLSNDECRSRLSASQAAQIHNSTLCTLRERGRGACFGDSGSPVTVQGQVVGVVSWGVPCARGFPDMHARVSVFSQWVQQVSGVIAV